MQRRASLLGLLVIASVGAASWVARAELVFDSQPMTEKSQIAQPDSGSVKAQQTTAVPQQQVAAPVTVTTPLAPPSMPSSNNNFGSGALSATAPEMNDIQDTQGLDSSGLNTSAESERYSERDSELRRSTRAELLRRARMREEIKNEDVLRARLEELRLREEQRLHDRLLRDEREQAQRDAMPIQQAAPAPVQVVEVVKAPVTEQKSESVAQVDRGFMEMADAIEGNSVSFTPMGGVMIFTQPSYGFDVRSRFSLGFATTVGIGQHFAVEGGYHFNQYGISAQTMNPFVNQLVYMNAALAQPFATESIVMNQHMADLGGRVYVLPRTWRVRPFVSGGVAYGFSSTNYNAALMAAVSPYGISLSRPYELHTLYGQVGAGVDFQITRNVSVGAVGKYYAPFAAWQNNAVQYGGYYLMGADRAIVGGTLGAMPLMSIQASASFTF